MIPNGTELDVMVKKVNLILVGGVQMFEGDVENLLVLVNSLGKNPSVVEIGTWTGHSACLIGQEIKRRDGHLFCVDTFDGTGSVLADGAGSFDIKKLLIENLKVSGVYGNTTIISKKSDDAVALFEDKSIDLLFIDGDHRYPQVCRDIENWIPKVRGIICGHDYDIDAWDINSPNVPFVFDSTHSEEDCSVYMVGDKKVAVHHGVLGAVHKYFGYDALHYGRIWFKDFR